MQDFKFVVKHEAKVFTGYEYVSKYSIKGQYFSMDIMRYTNRGFGCPLNVVCDNKNGSVWSQQGVMRELYSKENLKNVMRNLKENEEVTINIEC